MADQTRSDRADRALAAMRTVDSVDGEIRFTAHWGDSDRYVFLPSHYVAHDAGRALTRDEAVVYVRDNLDRYAAEARRQHGDESRIKIVIMERPIPA